MNPVAEIINNAKSINHYRKQVTAWQRMHDRRAPREGDLAPDFTLSDVTGERSVTLSSFRDKRPVALVFGSFT